MTFRETSAFPDRTDWQIAREVLRHAKFADAEQRIAERFTQEEVRRADAYLTAARHDTDRLTAIETFLKAVPEGWRQRDGDAGLIEDADGRPIAVLGASGDVHLPLGEFVAAAPAEAQWLAQQLRRAWAQLDRLRDRIDDAGSLMDRNYVASVIGYVPWSRETTGG